MFNAYIGFDCRMPDAYMVAHRTLANHAHERINIKPLLLPQLRAARAYTRPTTHDENGGMWDVVSEAPMATQFAISRFLIPSLEKFKGMAMFCDSDFMFRDNIFDLLDEIDKSKAVSVVKHQHAPSDAVKMDGQKQTSYARKNWSSMMILNNEHPSNRWLTIENVNKTPGRDLHRFCWLKDEEIGSVGTEWNWLAGHSSMDISPKAVHYTDGTPDMPGYENAPYADEFRRILSEI